MGVSQSELKNGVRIINSDPIFSVRATDTPSQGENATELSIVSPELEVFQVDFLDLVEYFKQRMVRDPGYRIIL